MQKSFILFSFLFVVALTHANGQFTRKVLFLGNSYTGSNNLPQLVEDVTQSAGDSLVYDSRTPGGYRLQDHFSDQQSLNKIAAETWDYMVLQGQSREPILGNSSFKQHGKLLKSQLKTQSPCGVTLFYMTWGRQNGDATFCPTYPEVCTYLSMDSTLREKYTELAQEAGAEISPVSAVWRYLRQNHSTIQLYTADGSHPSVAGSYAAACTFYTAIFKKDPNAITFDSSLNAADALAIRQATKTVVYDSLPQWNYQHQPHSNFQYTIGSGTNEVIFSPINFGVAQDYLWDFGDGNTSTSSNPTHSYATDGTYTVTLTTSICNLQGMSNSITDTVISFCSHTPNIFSNKTWLCNYDTLWTQTADTYQWYNGGVALPEMQRFLADYQQYNNFSFTVSSTVNGCSELSQVFLASPQWSGYYFDAAFGGDPCVGDTGIVAVLNGSGFTGTETIRWFKDGQPLPTFDNKDTLFVYTSGNYKGYVVDQSSNCPLDTTLIGPLSYQCLSTPEPLPEEEIVIYPNPASKVIGLELPVGLNTQKVYIYSANGLLIQKTILPSSQQVDISRLSPGLYYLLLDSKPESALKFIKQ